VIYLHNEIKGLRFFFARALDIRRVVRLRFTAGGRITMALKVYEIKIGSHWFKVRGATSGMKEGWLSWQGYDDKYEIGLARPGTWREKQKAAKKGVR
jgi:hypothetical protein